MRRHACFALTVFLLMGATLAVADTTDTLANEGALSNPTQARMAQVANALMASPEPQRQAVGLLLAETFFLWEVEHQPRMNESDFMDRLEALIEQADTGLARAFLAQLCAYRDLQRYCRQQGLDKAIVEFDGAELFARLHLTGNDETHRRREVVVAAEHLEERFMDYALILFEAIQAEVGLEMEESHAIMHAMTTGPRLSQISSLCRQPAVDDPELDQACLGILERMIDGTRSSILTMLGSSLMARRAEAQGEAGALAGHEKWRADYYDWLTCISTVNEEVWEAADADLILSFVDRWRRSGEASAHAFLATQAGVDCGLPPPPPGRAVARR